jgi:Kef-type K+ transport system membrane component KefB
MAGRQQASLAYHEPMIATVLCLSGFLLVLNMVNAILNRLLYCGLVGQLLIGVLWGVPGASWLDLNVQEVVQKLGYLGLIMLVYEG